MSVHSVHPELCATFIIVLALLCFALLTMLLNPDHNPWPHDHRKRSRRQ